MTAAYFEDHPTDPDKVILRKPYSTDCPNCEYHRKRAQRWRDEAYKQAGHPLPEREDDHALIDAGLLNSDLGILRKPPLDQGPDYERGFIDGMMYQTQTTVNKAVAAMTQPAYYIPSKDQRTWVGLTDKDYLDACQIAERGNYLVAFQRIQEWLKEKNT